MRLSDFQKHSICESAKHNFGQDTHVWLFGSSIASTTDSLIMIG